MAVPERRVLEGEVLVDGPGRPSGGAGGRLLALMAILGAVTLPAALALMAVLLAAGPDGGPYLRPALLAAGLLAAALWYVQARLLLRWVASLVRRPWPSVAAQGGTRHDHPA